MSDLIAYDRPVRNFMPELSATGHVTHTEARKTSVTFHHNGGRNTFEQVLKIWQSRAASAHFDVDSAGNVAQFVKVTEYAWAVGSKTGNTTSISIEMCNLTTGPKWEVSDATLAGATRLAGWLFAHVIKERPTAENFFPHQHWSSTDCPGPYVLGKWATLLAAVVKSYDSFVGTTVGNPPSNNHETNTQVAEEVIAGKWGNDPGRSKALDKAGYNAAAVQAAVNAILKKKPTSPPKETLSQVAKDVIAGKYGNGQERIDNLKRAGYDAAAVQAEVNREYKK